MKPVKKKSTLQKLSVLGFSSSNLELKLSHSSFKFQQLHVKSCFLPLKRSNLLLYSRVFGLLMGIMSLHLFFDLEVLIG